MTIPTKGALTPVRAAGLQLGDAFRSSRLPPDQLVIVVESNDSSGELWTLVLGGAGADKLGDLPHYWPIDEFEDSKCYLLDEELTVRPKNKAYRIDTAADPVPGSIAVTEDGHAHVRVPGHGAIDLVTGGLGKAPLRAANYNEWELTAGRGEDEITVYSFP